MPTDEMRHAMAECIVGDDVFVEDPTVNTLQNDIAALLGKEDALFVPSGCMSNQIALAIHAKAGDEVIVDDESHIFHYETAAPSIIARVQLRCVSSASQGTRGALSVDDVERAIRPGAYYFPRTSLVCIENSHNRYGGTVLTPAHFKELKELCDSRSLALHCDGARLWNACAALDVEPREFAVHCDTLSVCLSKGLGAPVGSLLVGSHTHIQAARRWRKILGGGMRQAGVLAAAGLIALHKHRQGLHFDHAHAAQFAKSLHESGSFIVDNYPTQTNIVIFRMVNPVDTTTYIERCQQHGLRISTGREGGWLRAVFHHQVSASQTQEAIDIIKAVSSNFAHN